MSWWASALAWINGEDLSAREARSRTLQEVDFWLRDEVWGSATTDAGVSVTEATAIAVPDVFACLNVVSTDVARCPIKYQRRTPDGDWIDAVEHPFWDLLQWLPNPETTAVDFWSSLVRDMQVYGAAYAEIVRNGVGDVMALWRLDPARVVVTRDAMGRKVYRYRATPNAPEQTWTFDGNRPPLLELHCWSWVQQCRNLIGTAKALDTYGAKYFANGAMPSGILQSAKGLSTQAATNLAKSWAALHGGAANAHKVAVLEDGVEFKALAARNTDSQYIELRRFLTERICGAAGVPPHKVAELGRSTNNNIEQQSRDYIERLAPYFTAIEQGVRRDLLTSRTWPRYRAVFDRDSLVQTDIQSLASAFSTFWNIGVYSSNDIRRKLKENPIETEGADTHYVQSNMAPMTGQPMLPAAPFTPTVVAPEETVA